MCLVLGVISLCSKTPVVPQYLTITLLSVRHTVMVETGFQSFATVFIFNNQCDCECYLYIFFFNSAISPALKSEVNLR